MAISFCLFVVLAFLLPFVESQSTANLTIWFLSSSNIKSAFEKCLDGFVALNPDISVEAVRFDQRAALNIAWRSVTLSSDPFPSLIAVDNGDIIPLADAGEIQDMTKRFALWAQERPAGHVFNDAHPNLKYDYSYNDQWWALPFELDVGMLIYRKDLYREILGSDAPPLTLTELWQNSILIQNRFLLKDNTSRMHGLPMACSGGNEAQCQRNFLSFQAAFNASLSSDGNSTCGFTTKEFRNALRAFTQMYLNESSPINPFGFRFDSPENDSTTPWMSPDVSDFLAGAAIHIFASPSVRDIILDQAPEFARTQEELETNVGFARIPSVRPPGFPAFLGGTGWVIPSFAPFPGEGWQLAKYLTDPFGECYAEHLVRQDGLLPAYNSVIMKLPRNGATEAFNEAWRYAIPQVSPIKDALIPTERIAAGLVAEVIQMIFDGMSVERAAREGCLKWDHQIGRFAGLNDTTNITEPNDLDKLMLAITTDQPVVQYALMAAAIVVVVIIGVVGLVILVRYRKRKQRILSSVPTGTVALVFTDIQDSTSLWEKVPSMGQALEKHNAIVRQAIAEHLGYEVKTIGDSFFVAFYTAKDAVQFCCAVQKNLLYVDWPPELSDHPSCETVRDNGGQGAPLFCGLRVRMGIHFGSVDVEYDARYGKVDYFGPAVNLAARVESLAFGGQILSTSEVFHSVRDHFDDDAIIHMGSFPFKGIPEPRPVYQIVSVPGRIFPPLRASDSVKSVDTCTKCARELVCPGCTAPRKGLRFAFESFKLTGRLQSIRFRDSVTTIPTVMQVQSPLL